MPEVQDPFESQQNAKCQKSKDENSVNREIATLLLNLASRTQNSSSITPSSLKQMPPSTDSYSKDFEPEAMDLSKYSKTHSTSSKSITTPTPVPQTANQSLGGQNPYSLLQPSLPHPLSNPSLAANIGSSYLLQNLLIGQIQNLTGSQQQPSPSGGHNNHQLLQSCHKPSPGLDLGLDTTKSAVAAASQQMSLANLGSSTIPLLSGHIVAQLNSLLFSVHGLADKSLEMNVQTQLAAIYSRLQEIVAMVAVAKKKETRSGKVVATEQPCQSLATSVSGSSGKDPSQSHQKQAESIRSSTNSSSITDEQKITKQLEEYQRALFKSNQKTEVGQQQQLNSNQSIAKILGSQTQISLEPLKVDTKSRKSCEDNSTTTISTTSSSNTSSSNLSISPRGEEISTVSVLENLRRRSSRDCYQDSSPPEKRSKCSVGDQLRPVVPPTSPQPTSSIGAGAGGSVNSKSKSSGKGGKGIRNRVFCGDCSGCLKNDDCGQCRYCRDKTKFGGQNRLRQKCLHRRCQMDSHRRSNGSASHAGASPCEGGVSTSCSSYSGVDLAVRYSARGAGGGGGNDADRAGEGDTVTRSPHSIFTSLLGTTPALMRDSRHSVAVDKISGDKDSQGQDGANGDTIQSRSDKWKAKHEAMLKLAVVTPAPVDWDCSPPAPRPENLSSSKCDSEEEPDPFENRNLVITIKDALKENNENHAVKDEESNEEPPDRKSERSHHKSKHSERSNKLKNSESKKDVNRLTTRSMKPVFAL